MTKETLCLKSKTTSISVVNNKISAILQSSTTKTGLRLYDNNCIGIAGALGAYDEDKLISSAKHMLSFKTPYECRPAENIKAALDLSGSFELTDTQFKETSERLLAALTEKFPQFSFSHKISYTETETALNNDLGTELGCKDKYVLVELVIKHKSSKNLFDGFGANLTRMYDFDDAFNTVSMLCGYYDNKVDLPEEKMPVVFLTGTTDIMKKFSMDLNGRMLGTGASMFSGKLGQKLFSDSFSLHIDRDPQKSYDSFFDAEGTVLPDNKFTLIENGVLKSPYTSKKIAKQFGYSITGSAAGDYDSVPDASPQSMELEHSGKTIKELLGGRKAVYIVSASGGDYTSQGEYASPVQAAYLFDGEKFYGRLPQISISSNIYDMFGADYIGRATDGSSPNNPFKYMALDMKVGRIGDWM